MGKNVRKKAFTLAELLGVVVVIGLLLLIIIPLIINGVSGREDDVESLQNEIIFDATDEHLDSDQSKYPNIAGNVYCVSIGELLEAGKLVDPVKKLVEEGNYSASATIKITVSGDGVRRYELVDATQCKAQNSEDIAITISPANNVWSQEKKVTIVYPTLDGSNMKSYTRDNGSSWVNVSRNDIELTYQEDGSISAKVEDSNGNSLAEKSEEVERIDRINPSVVNISQGAWNNLQQQVNITLTDDKSGVAGYYISTSKTKPLASASGWEKYELSPYGGVGTISLYLPYGTYYVFVKDRAGNVSDYSANNSIAVTDNQAPKCTITASGTKGNKSWYRGNVKLTLSYSDEGGSGVASYDLTSSSSASYNGTKTVTQTSDTTGKTFYGYVKDGAGNTGKCSLTVKKDTAAPTVPSNGYYNSKQCRSFRGVYNNIEHRFYIRFRDTVSGVSTVGYAYKYTYLDTWSDYRSQNSIKLKRSNTIVRELNADGSYKDIRQDYNLAEVNKASFKFKVCDVAGNCANYGNYSVPAVTASSTNRSKYCRDLYPTSYVEDYGILPQCSSSKKTMCYVTTGVDN